MASSLRQARDTDADHRQTYGATPWTKRSTQGREFRPGNVSVSNFGEFDAKPFRAVSSNLAVGPGLFLKLDFKFRISFLGRQPIKNDGTLRVVNNPFHA
jgi:hypothetical protein